MAGTEVAATIPIADRLLNELIAAQLPPNAPVREVRIDARGGNTFAVRARLAKPSFLPPFTLTFGIARQPQLPHEPDLVLEPAASGLVSFMAWRSHASSDAVEARFGGGGSRYSSTDGIAMVFHRPASGCISPNARIEKQQRRRVNLMRARIGLRRSRSPLKVLMKLL